MANREVPLCVPAQHFCQHRKVLNSFEGVAHFAALKVSLLAFLQLKTIYGLSNILLLVFIVNYFCSVRGNFYNMCNSTKLPAFIVLFMALSSLSCTRNVIITKKLFLTMKYNK